MSSNFRLGYLNFCDILSYRQPLRCLELQTFFENTSISDLHNLFPTLINAIFDLRGPGWNLRKITRETAPVEFDTLHDFFSPLCGPMIRLCYRLMDTAKYEIPISCLPIKLQHMLIYGKYPSFYAQRVIIDVFSRRVVGLKLNSFDYFLYYFALYGLIPYHNLYPMVAGPRTMHVPQNERLETIYLMLAANFFWVFVPSNPDVYLLAPQIAPKPASTPVVRPGKKNNPAKTLKYLLPQRLLHYSQPETKTHTTEDLAQLFHWRTESIIYIVLDTWFGIDDESSGVLPHIDLVRYIRMFVKQLHAFTNCTAMGPDTQVETLRCEVAQLLGPRIITFLRTLFISWPLDNTFTDVLELWLSFIQPWRYVDGKPRTKDYDQPVNDKYRPFIAANLNAYCELFARLMSRLAECETLLQPQTNFLFRTLKVFGKGNLLQLLRQEEENPPRTHTQPNPFGSLLVNVGNKWNLDAFLDDESEYLKMFSSELRTVLEVVMVKLSTEITARRHVAAQLKVEETNTFSSWKNWVPKSLARCMEREKKLVEVNEELGRLEFTASILEQGFGILPVYDYPEVHKESSASETSTISQLSPLDPTHIGDPALKPIISTECIFLVRFLYQVSLKLNIMFGDELSRLWDHGGTLGAIARRLLVPPSTIVNFDLAQKGMCIEKVVKTKHIGPRVCLRFLGSYTSIVTICSSFLLGYVLLGAPSFGFIALILVAFSYAMLTKPENVYENLMSNQ
ncbi:sphingomyelin phosphodiesterase 4 [Anopheles nili]|uniref:sphingomyelin phosphodiesterase 4 n=1 Tax=Anopheles nili TaxID=185578 RepID=UPI00237C1AE5|nr:sphingomyelin phosphodiesterase 4 [Anopheles nili]